MKPTSKPATIKRLVVIAFLEDGSAHQVMIDKEKEPMLLPLVASLFEGSIKVHLIGLPLDLNTEPRWKVIYGGVKGDIS